MSKEESSNNALDVQVAGHIETKLSQMLSVIEAMQSTNDSTTREIVARNLGLLLSVEDELLNTKPKNEKLM